jgi:ketopantoate reductase
MKIAIMGTGGVGGYFGARLAQGGADVAFVARGAHLAALQEEGLTVESASATSGCSRSGPRTIRRRSGAWTSCSSP